mgnify:CR=1 FL=1
MGDGTYLGLCDRRACADIGDVPGEPAQIAPLDRVLERLSARYPLDLATFDIGITPAQVILNAIEFHEDREVSEVITALCQGCGACVATCPSQAIYGAHFTNDQVMAEIEGVLWDVFTSEPVPA